MFLHFANLICISSSIIWPIVKYILCRLYALDNCLPLSARLSLFLLSTACAHVTRVRSIPISGFMSDTDGKARLVSWKRLSILFVVTLLILPDKNKIWINNGVGNLAYGRSGSSSNRNRLKWHNYIDIWWTSHFSNRNVRVYRWQRFVYVYRAILQSCFCEIPTEFINWKCTGTTENPTC